MKRRIAMLALGAMAGNVACSSLRTESAFFQRSVAGLSVAESPGAGRGSRSPRTRGLRFDVHPAEARVVVDGEHRGTVSHLKGRGGVLELPPGIHQISIQQSGYATWRAEVTVGERVEPIRVSLVPET